MKKTISLLCLSMAIATSFAQLKVDSLGRVGIGGSTSNNYTMTISPAAASGILINNTSKATTQIGIEIQNSKGSASQMTGLYIGPGSGSTTQNVYGTRSIAGQTSGYSYGTYGALFNYGGNLQCQGAGIYGSNTLDGIDFAYPGAYAGYFKGDVRVTGTLYATVSTPTTNSTSPSASAVAVNTMSNDQQLRVVDRLQDVQLLQFEGNEQSKRSSILPKSDLFNLEEGEFVSQNMLDEYAKTTGVHKTKVSYGLAADQLKEVYPELVYEDADGNVSINYIEMIPLLVQSINELSAKIEELENGNSDDDFVLMSKERGNATDINEVDETEILSLSQNRPNPFSESTTIEVTVPESTRTAAIFIYDMSGKQEKQISISERGKVSVSVTSEGLTPGMYLYSLIADGKVVSTKKMILTK